MPLFAQRSKRAFLAREILQISSMDCGVAAVACLLDGYGIRCNYEWLREKCRTSVDGTSVDSLEDLCRELGVELCQHVIPLDYLREAMEGRYPLIAIARRGTAASPHFVVVWRRIGSYVQIMDPAGGRKWTTIADFARELYVHPLELSPPRWRAWMETGALRAVIQQRVRRLLSPALASRVCDAMRRLCPSEVSGVEASLRLVDESAARAPRSSVTWRDELFGRVLAAAHLDAHRDVNVIPSRLRSVVARGPSVVTTGAVLLGPALPRTRVPRHAVGAPLAPEGADAATPRRRETPAPERSFWHELSSLLEPDGTRLFYALGFGALVTSVASTVEILFYRGALDAPRLFTTFSARAGAAAVFVALAVVVLGLELSLSVGSARLGRQLELALRQATLRALPRIDLEFIRSRPTSDLAYRAHGLAAVRNLLGSVLHVMRGGGDLAVTLLAIAWLDPRYLLPVLGFGATLAASLVLSRSRLRELDTRTSVHASRLLALFLDALRGPRPIRLHGYQDAFRAEQQRELGPFRTTGMALVRARARLAAVDGFFAVALLAIIFLLSVLGHGEPRAFILLAFWAFRVPGSLALLFEFAQSYPVERLNLTRLLEVTRYAPADDGDAIDIAAPAAKGIQLSLRDVTVVVNGTTLLHGVDLEVPPGEHVAVVGRSGAGKSTLVGLPLGLHRPEHGELRVDGTCLDARTLCRLREETAWVDPSVTLWNTSVRDNLAYAARRGASRPVLHTLEAADLLDVVNRLERGMDTSIGPEGKLVSGGEGQRVRLGRALVRPDVRLVVMDEAFRGLDRATRTRLANEARRIWASATLFFVTHDISHALLFDRVLVVENGRVVEDGVPSRLANGPSRFHQLLDAETSARANVWGAKAWRRVHVADGTLHDAT